jgi:regulator of replication initiation timing
LKDIPRQFEAISQQFGQFKEENHQLKEENHQLKETVGQGKRARRRHKEQVRKLKLRNEALQCQIDEQKTRGVLVCVYCRSSRTTWKMLGCGHMLCTGCEEHIKSQGPLYEYPCPQCKAPIKSCVDCFPNLVEL